MLADYWVKRHWKLLLLIFIGLCVLGQLIFQIVYPSSRLIPGTSVEGVDLGGMRKEEAAKKLDGLYGALELKIYFGKNDAAFLSPKMSEVGIGTDNSARIEAINYPFWLRFIPTSIWWAPTGGESVQMEYVYDKNKIAEYTQSKVGTDCSIPPQNATLKLVGTQLQLVPALSGGVCDLTEFQHVLAEVRPDSGGDNSVRIDVDETPAPVTDDMARDLAAKLNGRLSSPMPISVDKATDEIPGRVVLSWLDFIADVPKRSIDDSANQQASLKFSVNADRMKDYLNQGIAAKLIKKPGISKVSTLDFKETSRVNGANGRDLDVPKIKQSVEDYINGKVQKATGATKVVGPTMQYTRKYTPTTVGFQALLAQYAQDNPGTWGLAFTELSGVRHLRSASYNANAKFPAAGIHSLYLAYTYIMEQHDGKTRPVDRISGETNALNCFKLMLQQFDQGCRDGFYAHFGHATLTSRGKELGLKNTIFADRDTQTSAADLQKVMVGLYKSQIARIEGGQKIISDSTTTRQNAGIPAGASVAEIAHIIGESDTIHHDTAIVFDTNYGTYVLTILSDGSSWEKVADLAKKVAELKRVKMPPDAR